MQEWTTPRRKWGRKLDGTEKIWEGSEVEFTWKRTRESKLKETQGSEHYQEWTTPGRKWKKTKRTGCVTEKEDGTKLEGFQK